MATPLSACTRVRSVSTAKIVLDDWDKVYDCSPSHWTKTNIGGAAPPFGWWLHSSSCPTITLGRIIHQLSQVALRHYYWRRQVTYPRRCATTVRDCMEFASVFSKSHAHLWHTSRCSIISRVHCQKEVSISVTGDQFNHSPLNLGRRKRGCKANAGGFRKIACRALKVVRYGGKKEPESEITNKTNAAYRSARLWWCDVYMVSRNVRNMLVCMDLSSVRHAGLWRHRHPWWNFITFPVVKGRERKEKNWKNRKLRSVGS